ncbi:MAG TPA: cell envelope integrity protein CreD [Spirochaetia bacterium]|nr:cell envelope integrity protein CreD [Spirochaetia bacterium]
MKAHDFPSDAGGQHEPVGSSPNALSRAARKHSVIAKILLIAFLLLLLLWPILMFQALVHEREQRRQEVEAEIMDSWGGEQTLAGPFLSVPYISRSVDANGKRIETIEIARFLPETLRVDGSLLPQKRSRGMYDVTVYSAALTVSGRFQPPDFTGWRVSPSDILWDQAALSLELPDMRALQDRVALSWGRERGEFRSAKGTTGMFAGEMRASIPGLGPAVGREYIPFSFVISLHGGDSLRFLPLGDETTVRLSAPWQSPNFNGSYLPTERNITAQGFEARWHVISMTRAFPQRWRDAEIEPASILSTAFGVSLMTPVDTYQKVTRALKYAMLFLFLPFCTLFLFEIFTRRRIHPLQYLLVGLGDCIFYLLLLSLAEHVNFGAAYAIGAASCTVTVTLYTMAVVRSRSGAIMLPVLAAAYGFLAVVLYSEDSALLIGSLGLFALLSGVMYLTRKVDWYKRDQLPATSGREPGIQSES